MTIKIADLKIGQSALVDNIVENCDKKLKQRLRDMGFVSGQKITILKKSIFGDPIKISIKNYEISIRKKEADLIKIKND